MGTTTWIGRKAERKHESESAASSALSLLKEKIVNAKDAALAYRELMKYRYKFLLGHKGRAETLVLSFPKEAFHHLAGLHKIGLSRVRNKKYALDSILDDEITVEDSRQVMSDRWDCVCDLKRMIESNSLVFRLQKKTFPGSQIRADYLITEAQCLFFIKDGEPLSIFTARDDQMTNAHRSLRLTTLMIEREELETGIVETLYVSEAYKH